MVFNWALDTVFEIIYVVFPLIYLAPATSNSIFDLESLGLLSEQNGFILIQSFFAMILLARKCIILMNDLNPTHIIETHYNKIYKNIITTHLVPWIENKTIDHDHDNNHDTDSISQLNNSSNTIQTKTINSNGDSGSNNIQNTNESGSTKNNTNNSTIHNDKHFSTNIGQDKSKSIGKRSSSKIGAAMANFNQTQLFRLVTLSQQVNLSQVQLQATLPVPPTMPNQLQIPANSTFTNASNRISTASVTAEDRDSTLPLPPIDEMDLAIKSLDSNSLAFATSTPTVESVNIPETEHGIRNGDELRDENVQTGHDHENDNIDDNYKIKERRMEKDKQLQMDGCSKNTDWIQCRRKSFVLACGIMFVITGVCIMVFFINFIQNVYYPKCTIIENIDRTKNPELIYYNEYCTKKVVNIFNNEYPCNCRAYSAIDMKESEFTAKIVEKTMIKFTNLEGIVLVAPNDDSTNQTYSFTKEMFENQVCHTIKNNIEKLRQEMEQKFVKVFSNFQI